MTKGPIKLLPQWDTVAEEPYYTTESGCMAYSLEEAGRLLELGEAVVVSPLFDEDLNLASERTDEEGAGSVIPLVRRS